MKPSPRFSPKDVVSIYCLTDEWKTSIYVGKTAIGRERRRWIEHRHNGQMAPLGNITMVILDQVPKTEWPEKEQYWIDYFSSRGFTMYNKIRSGTGGEPSREAETNCWYCRKAIYTIPSQQRLGRGRFCSRKCRGKFRSGIAFHSKIKTICQCCQKVIYISPHKQKNGKGKFCSRSCRSKSYSDKLHNNFNTYNLKRKLNKIKKIRNRCKICLAPIFTKNRKYCSSDCRKTYYWQHISGRYRSLVTCVICKKSFSRNNWRLITYKLTVCSRPCYMIWCKKTGRFIQGENNHAAKLTPKQIKEIRTLRDKQKQKDIAERYDISQTTVSKIQIGKNWHHLPYNISPKLMRATPEQIKKIRALQGVKRQSQIAKQFHLSQATISRIQTRKSGAHII